MFRFARARVCRTMEPNNRTTGPAAKINRLLLLVKLRRPITCDLGASQLKISTWVSCEGMIGYFLW